MSTNATACSYQVRVFSSRAIGSGRKLGRRLLVAAADLCQLAGFVAADNGRYAEAKRLHATGMRAAHAGGDTESAANNLSSIAYIEANVGDPRRAVLLLKTARAVIPSSWVRIPRPPQNTSSRLAPSFPRPHP